MLAQGYNIGGEQSGHIIFRDFAKTGDGQLTAAQLFSLVRRSGKPLSELASVMTSYPQTIVNISVSKEGKLQFFTDPTIKEAIDSAKAELGDDGRVVVRPSGTEPLIRIMVEGKDKEVIVTIAARIAETINSALGQKA